MILLISTMFLHQSHIYSRCWNHLHHNERESNMNFENNQTASGSVMTMAQHVASELRKSGTKVWSGLPSPKELKQLRTERAEREFQKSKRGADAKDRRREALTQRAKQIFKGENSDE
jgi:hypothetical protein